MTSADRTAFSALLGGRSAIRSTTKRRMRRAGCAKPDPALLRLPTRGASRGSASSVGDPAVAQASTTTSASPRPRATPPAGSSGVRGQQGFGGTPVPKVVTTPDYHFVQPGSNSPTPSTPGFAAEPLPPPDPREGPTPWPPADPRPDVASLWRATAVLPFHDPPHGRRGSYDVVVIGGGYTRPFDRGKYLAERGLAPIWSGQPASAGARAGAPGRRRLRQVPRRLSRHRRPSRARAARRMHNLGIVVIRAIGRLVEGMQHHRRRPPAPPGRCAAPTTPSPSRR